MPYSLHEESPGPAHTHGEMTRGRDHREARILEQLPTAHLRRADGLRGLLLECAESTCHTGGQEIAPHSRCFPRPSFADRAVFSHRWGTRPPIAISQGGALLLFPEAFSPLHSYISSTYSASLWVKLDVLRREFSLPAGDFVFFGLCSGSSSSSSIGLGIAPSHSRGVPIFLVVYGA